MSTTSFEHIDWDLDTWLEYGENTPGRSSRPEGWNDGWSILIEGQHQCCERSDQRNGRGEGWLLLAVISKLKWAVVGLVDRINLRLCREHPPASKKLQAFAEVEFDAFYHAGQWDHQARECISVLVPLKRVVRTIKGSPTGSRVNSLSHRSSWREAFSAHSHCCAASDIIVPLYILSEIQVRRVNRKWLRTIEERQRRSCAYWCLGNTKLTLLSCKQHVLFVVIFAQHSGAVSNRLQLGWKDTILTGHEYSHSLPDLHRP